MGLKSLEDVTYFRLNNEINRPVNGQIMLHKDKEALDAFFKENVAPNTMVFDKLIKFFQEFWTIFLDKSCFDIVVFNKVVDFIRY